MKERHTPLRMVPSDEGRPARFTGILFMDEVFRLGHRELVLDDWRCKDPDTVQLPETFREGFRLVRGYESAGSFDLLGNVGGCVVRVSPHNRRVSVWVAGPTRREVAEVVDLMRRIYREPEHDEGDPRVPVDFWFHVERGRPQSRTREIRVASWAGLSANYARHTRAGLERLMSGRPDPSAGRLFLWHGPPGTGKTWAIRALAWEWRDWCDVHYITDPEVFLGNRASYLIEVALDGRERDDRWRLLVLEDTGEMMAVDAKAQVGQALSRLLNLTDGLIGQGMRIMLLVTSNEPVSKMHPAIVRPGRCAADVAFHPLSPSEADAWIVARDAPPAGRAMTIADLHGLVQGGLQGERDDLRVGFSADR